ncbi:MAG: sialidase family protein [Cyclobacteriaceae bacterium]
MKKVLQSLCLMSMIDAQAQSVDRDQLQDLFFTGMKSGVACYRIPAVTTAPDGTLLAAIDERLGSCRDLGQNEDINIVMRKSSDHGQTWTQVQTLVDFPVGQSASDPSFIVDYKGKIVFLFYNYMDLKNHKGKYRIHLIMTKDNGVTWSAPKDVTDQIFKPEWGNSFVFVTSGNGIQTQDGTLLHTLVHVGEKSGYVFGSMDGGKTWALMSPTLTPADESKIVELSDGTWMVNARVNGLGSRYIHQSSDQGKTWTGYQDQNLIDSGCNGAILSFRDPIKKNSRLLFINPSSSFSRENLTLKLSDEDGKNWKTSKVIYSGSSAYSSVTITGLNQIGVFFECENYSRMSFKLIRLN